MTSAKTTLIIIGASLCVGFSLNSCSEPTPETRVVKVPTVHVVTKTVTVKSDAVPIPESCTKAFTLAQGVAAPDSTMTEAAGNILAKMSDVERNALRDDFKAMNQALTDVRRSRDALGTSAIEAAELRRQLAVAVDICNADLEEQT